MRTWVGAYGLPKAGDMQLARDLAVEWGPQGIRVDCVAPGLIETKMAGMLLADPGIQSFTQQKLPLRRVGQPREIAGAIAFLVSPAAAFVTGQVDGSTVRHDQEGTGFGWKQIASVDAQTAAQATTCRMKRPV